MAHDQHSQPSPQLRQVPAAFSGWAKPTPRAVAQMVCDTLTLTRLDGLVAYWGLAIVLRAKLNSSERQGLAWAALMACDDEEAVGIAEAVLTSADGVGPPLPPFFEDVVEDAACWSERASGRELRAYAMACLARLPPEERQAMVDALRRRSAA